MIPTDRQHALTHALGVLHAKKSAAYGNSWRKRGELLSIFPNVARKYDRLEVAMQAGELDLAAAGGLERTVEPLLDTLADLAIYAVKYLTFLAETQASAFPPDLDSSSFAEFGSAFRSCRNLVVGAGLIPVELFGEIAAGMRRIEVALIERPTADAQQEKVRAVAIIAAASLALLDHVAGASPDLWSRFTFEVEAL